MNRTVVTNAKWLTPDGEFRDGSIIIEEGKIKDLVQKSSLKYDAKSFDASGAFILPGAIDPHVHFREPGQIYKEGISNASKASLKGGVTTIIDMPNNNPACSTAKRLSQKKELFRRKSHVNWGLMFHTSAANREPVQKEIKSAKIYMARSSALPAITSERIIKELLEHFPVVSFHAEDESTFDTSPGRSPLHHENRLREAITTALSKIESALGSIPSSECPRIIICHMNTADEVDWVRRMKNNGFDVWAETAPHYLYFTQDDYIAEGNTFKVNPPIRTKEDQLYLREAISSGDIDFIGTDHAPHSKEEKGGANPPSGIASIEWLILLMLDFVDKGQLTWKRYHELTCAKAADCYSIKNRDGIKKGNYADLIFVKQRNMAKAVSGIQTKAAEDLYKQNNFKWYVDTVMVNGILKYIKNNIYEDGKGYEI